MQEIIIPNLQTVQERVLVAEAFKFTAWHIHFRATNFTLNKCSKPQTGSSWHILASATLVSFGQLLEKDIPEEMGEMTF